MIRSLRLLSLAMLGFPCFAAGAFDVRDFGALGNNKANDGQAIQRAIDACRKGGGGTVVLPAGTYRSGTIRLASDITLFLEPGAVLQSIESPEALTPQGGGRERYLIVAQDATNVSIMGQGVIQGTGIDDYGWRWGVPMKRSFRARLIHFLNCRGVRVQDVTLRMSESFTLVLEKCSNVTVRGIEIDNNLHHENTDGIDVFNCSDVRISDCRISAGDDAIVLKSTDKTPSENIVVTNCVLRTTCSGLKFGTGTRGDFRNIHFSNIAIHHGEQGIGFFLKDGGTIERVTFSNISLTASYETTRYPTLADARKEPKLAHMLADPGQTFGDYNIWLNIEQFPILIDLNKRSSDAPYGQIRDVLFSGIQIQGRSGLLVQGRPERPIQNLRMRDVTFRVDAPLGYDTRHISVGGTQNHHDRFDTEYARKPSYATFAYVEGLEIDGFRLDETAEAAASFDRTALDIAESVGVRVRGAARGRKDGKAPVVRLENCRGALIAESEPANFARISGRNTAQIRVLGAAGGLNVDSDVPAKEVKTLQ